MTSFVEAAFISLLQACHPKVKIKQILSPLPPNKPTSPLCPTPNVVISLGSYQIGVCFKKLPELRPVLGVAFCGGSKLLMGLLLDFLS